MKRKIWLNVFVSMALFSCNPGKHARDNGTVAYSFPDVIPTDSANKMLNSYLNSINYQVTDTNVESVIFSAPLLRKYLDSLTSSGDIAFIKVMLAHKLSYINAGYGNQNAGFSNSALTLLIAGYTANGDYVYFPENLIIDNGMLCPNNCPPGTAANPLFPNSSKKK